MSKSTIGTVPFSSNFNVKITAPLDDRLVVDSIDDLQNKEVIDYPYVGMVLYVKETPNSLWLLTSIDYSRNPVFNWQEFRDITCNTVETKSELTSIERAYVGMVVYVKNMDGGENSDGKGHSLWVLIDEDSTKIENWHEFKDWETTQEEFPIKEMVKELQEQIDNLKDWIDSMKVSQTRIRQNEDGTIQFFYDKEEPRSDKITYDDSKKSLIVEHADPNDWSRKILVYDGTSGVMKIVEDK